MRYCLLVFLFTLLCSCEATHAQTITMQEVAAADLPLQLSGAEQTWFYVWGSWCAPCIKKLPELVKKNSADASLTIHFVAVEDDGGDKAVALLKKHGYKGRLLLITASQKSKFDINGELRKAFGVAKNDPNFGYPQNYIVDINGTLLGYSVGERPKLEEAETAPFDWNAALDEMGENDMLYRKMLVRTKEAEKSSKDVRELLENPKRYHRWRWSKIGLTQGDLEKVYASMNALDSVNYRKLMALVEQHGYPDRRTLTKRNANALMVMNLHYIWHEKEYAPILKRAVLNGKWPALNYVRYYDRCRLADGGYVLYATEYLAPWKCIEDLEKTNEAREEIGLPAVEQRKKCR